MKARMKTRPEHPSKPVKKEFPLVGADSQKSGFLEALPTALFYVIQGFLSALEYHNLMNANISGFQSIKSETIQYSIVLPTKLSKGTEKDILRVLKSVKNTSAQIAMRFQKPKEDTMIRYSILFVVFQNLVLEQAGRDHSK
jgi:hypothetical protein